MITKGKLIKEYRKKAKITSTQLAEMIGVTQGTISQIETEKREPTPVLFRKIIKALNIPKEEARHIKTPIDEFLDKPIKSISAKFKIGITEITCTISSEIRSDMNLNELKEDEVNQLQAQFEYLSPVYINAITKVLLQNKKQINEQIKLELENKSQITEAKIENQNDNEE